MFPDGLIWSCFHFTRGLYAGWYINTEVLDDSMTKPLFKFCSPLSMLPTVRKMYQR